MEFDLTEGQQQIQSLARDVAQKELAPKAAEIDRTSTFPRDGLKKLAEIGLMGMGVPRDFGGSRSDTLSYLLAVEEIAKACASTAMILTDHADASSAIAAGASGDLKTKYLTALARGEKLSTFAVTEPGSGCNVFNVETTARPDGEYYVVNGSKVFITSGEEAEIYVVVVRTKPDQPGPFGQSVLLVERGSSGFSFGSGYDRMGFRGTAPREIIFEECRVPKANLLGGEEGFMAIQMAIGGRMQLGTAAISLGIAQAAVEAAIKHAKGRLQVGRQPLTAYQAVKFTLVEMSTIVDAARAMMYQAARNLDSGPPAPPLDCFKAKLFTTEMAIEVTNKALQVHGGTGYCSDLPIERYCRDARGLTLHALPTEMLKDTIAMFLLG